MLDPFPLSPPPWLSHAVQPFADYANLPTLPLHAHEVLISFSAYTFINLWLAPVLSRAIFPVRYGKLSPERKMSWNVHVVSLVQSCTINVLALWVMYVDEERKNMDAEQRVWGYTGAAGMIQGMAAGYFLWDLLVTLRNVKLFGYGMLAHAVSALVVFSFGFRPFINFYSSTFILYELSSPFLNMHWFFDKLDMTGSLAQLVNGIFLLVTFFSCRLVWGTYQSFHVFKDIFSSLHFTPSPSSSLNQTSTPDNNIMHFTTTSPGVQHIPLSIAFLYLGSNLVLNTLNYYWFGKMIETLRKRFGTPPAGTVPAKDGEKKVSAHVATGADGKTRVVLDEKEVRRRKIAEGEEEGELPAAA